MAFVSVATAPMSEYQNEYSMHRVYCGERCASTTANQTQKKIVVIENVGGKMSLSCMTAVYVLDFFHNLDDVFVV